ncbi:MAG: metallophosphoesterase family protein [Candidatus Bathyarchaeia archaeon]
MLCCSSIEVVNQNSDNILLVYGNMDKADLRAKLPEINSVEVYDWKIGVMHDPSALWGTRRMKKVAKQNGFDVLVYGHTHRSSIKREEGTLFINPGSPTNPIPPFLVKPSVALLRIKKEKIDPEIVRL